MVVFPKQSCRRFLPDTGESRSDKKFFLKLTWNWRFAPPWEACSTGEVLYLWTRYDQPTMPAEMVESHPVVARGYHAGFIPLLKHIDHLFTLTLLPTFPIFDLSFFLSTFDFLPWLHCLPFIIRFPLFLFLIFLKRQVHEIGWWLTVK